MGWPAPPPANFAGSVPSIPAYAVSGSVSTRTGARAVAERSVFLADPDPVGLYVEPSPTAPATLVKLSETRSARRLRLVTLILVGLTMSGLGVIDYLGGAIPLTAYFGSGLLVVGIALILATWLGRARGVLGLGVVLGITTLIFAAVGQAELPQVMTPTKTYTTISELVPGDSVDVGELTVDLSQLALTADAAYTASVDLGHLDVIVPKDARVIVHYSNDLGATTVFGTDIAGGTELAGDVTDPVVAKPGQPTLTLDLSVDVGKLEVRR